MVSTPKFVGARPRGALLEGKSERVAVEARDLVRRAAGDVAGLAVAGQVGQVARHPELEADDWRVRDGTGAPNPGRRRWTNGGCLVRRDGLSSAGLEAWITALRRLLNEPQQQVAELEAEVRREMLACADDG